MGKKTTKRKTRWRTLSIGEVPSDTEEENQENPYYNRTSSKFRAYNNTDNLSEHSSGGGGGGNGSGSRPPYHRYNSHPYSTTSSQSSSTTTTNQRAASTTQSSHSTPIRNRYRNSSGYGGYGEKYKSSRSNSTASEPKITFNEDEYTRITTPRQDVLFKKGYLSKKKPTVVSNGDNSCAQINGGSIGSGASSNDGQMNATTNGGSCGESNPSTGYNSTTGGGTPEHHSLDGGDYYDTDLEQPQQFIFHNGFVDQHGVFYVNGYDPYSVMLIGPPPPPPGQFIHPVDFYPPPSAGVPCFPQIVPSTVFNPVDSAASISSKACSTDSQTESNSPHNEIESGDTNFASSEQSQSSSSVYNHVDNESENDGIKKKQEPPTTLEHSSESDNKLIVNGEADDEHSDKDEKSKDETDAEAETPTVTDGGVIATTVIVNSESSPEKPQDTSSKDEQKIAVTTTTTQSSNDGLLEHNFIPTATAIFHPHHQAAAPTHFFMAPPAGFISFAPPPPLPAPHPHHTPHHPSHGQNLFINEANVQTNRVLNNTETIETNRQRYIQRRRRRKISRSQNEIENKYSDNSDSTGEEFEDENYKNSHIKPQQLSHTLKQKENLDTMKEKSNPVQVNGDIKTEKSVSNNVTNSNSDNYSNEKLEIKNNVTEAKENNAEDKIVLNELPVNSIRNNQMESTETTEKKINSEKNVQQNGNEKPLEETNTNVIKENKSIVYKVDAEEFIPRSMRQQTPVKDSEKIINPDLRAKFENYLNRQELRQDFPVHNFVPNSEFVYAIPTSSAHTAEIYINPLDGISDHVTSFPPHTKFIPHQQFGSRKQHTFGNNYNNKKRQKYSKPNYYYRKSNSVEASTSTQDEELNGETDSQQSKTFSTTNETVQTEKGNKSTVLENKSNLNAIINENNIKKTEQNGVTNQGIESVSPAKENKEKPKANETNISSAPTKERIAVNEKDEKPTIPSKNSSSAIENTKEVVTPSVIPLTNDKPKNNSINKEIPKQSPAKITKTNTRTSQQHISPANNVTAVPKTPKNYAQILRKVDNDKKNQKVTKLDIAKAATNANIKTNITTPKSAEPVHRTCPKLLNNSKSLPTTPNESEWISVPSRKKSKGKHYAQNASNVSTSLQDNYLIQETVEEVIKVEYETETKEPVVEEIIEIKEVREIPLKKDSLEENSQKISSASVAPVHLNKASPSTKNKIKNTNKQKREPSVKKATTKPIETKTEKHTEKPKVINNDTENTSNNSAKVKEEVHNPEKARKARSKSLKKTPQKESPAYTYSNTAIIESIDNLRKMANEHSKTNLEISQEMDRIIQQGLYKNLGDKIKSLDQDEKFLSVLDTTKLDILPRLLFESKFQTNDSVPEFNIMETLTECQKLFAYKGAKDINDIKDIKHTNVISKSRENSISKELPGKSDEKVDESVQVKKNDNFTISDKSCNLSASSVNEDELVTTDGVETTTIADNTDLNFSNNETKSDIKNVETIDEIDLKNMPSTSGLQNNDADLSDNDETLISFKFDSNENISVITEEPRASIPNDFTQPLSEYNDDGDVSKHSPDPDSWSSHTNMTTTTEAHSVTTSTEFTAKLSSSHKSLTEVVKEWLHEAKEKTPDIDVLKSPDKLYREKSAPPKLYRQYSSTTSLSTLSGDESEPEVGLSSSQPKNVKGNPLFAASAKSNHSFLSLMGETLLEPIAKSGYTSSVPGAAIGEDALLVNRRVASNSDIDHVHIEEEYSTTAVEDFRTIAKRRIKENVAVFAREFVNTVNPVVDGVNISENECLDEFKINTNYCCEVNEQTDLNNENNLRDECRIARSNRKVINITNIGANDNNNGTNFMIRGAFVRDVGVIKRAVSENGAIFNNIVNNVPNINYNEDVNKNVNKSKSCVDMKLLFVKENGKRNDVSSTSTSTSSSSSTVYTTSRHNIMASREGSEESKRYGNAALDSMDDLLECWDHDLLNNEKPLINMHHKNDAKICIKNNLMNSSNEMTEVSAVCKKELNTDIAERKESGENDNDDEVIEHYESVYGKNFDYLEIRQKVLNECEQQRAMNGIIGNEPPCVAGRGAVCCSVM